jgi:NDP-sugar pyrophosphorylase family protein
MGKSFSLEHDFFPKLVGNGLCGFRCKESFIDIGTPDSYGKANQFFKIYEVK